jgi:hypothetical protein
LTYLAGREMGEITCRKRIRNPGPFEDKEKEYTIPVLCTFGGQHADGTHLSPENTTAHDSILTAQMSEEWQTIVSLLKPDDKITLNWWAAGASNGYLQRSEVKEGHGMGEKLYADILTMRIHRGEITNKLVFRINESICPDNTARMIRHR